MNKEETLEKMESLMRDAIREPDYDKSHDMYLRAISIGIYHLVEKK